MFCDNICLHTRWCWLLVLRVYLCGDLLAWQDILRHWYCLWRHVSISEYDCHTCMHLKYLCCFSNFDVISRIFSCFWLQCFLSQSDQVSPIDLECVRPCLIRLPLDISCPNTSSGRDFYPLLWAWSFQMCPMDWLPSARSLETVGLRLLLSQAIMSSSSTNTMECQVSMAGRQSLLLIQKCASESSAPNLPMED